MPQILLPLNRLSNLDVVATLDEDGMAVDMTGWAVDVTEVNPPALTSGLVIFLLAPSLREVKITLPGQVTGRMPRSVLCASGGNCRGFQRPCPN